MKIVEALQEKQRLAQFTTRIKNYLKIAIRLIQGYKADEPFSTYSKRFFTADKQYGSRDRKYILSLCYYYFRLGQSVKTISVEERILTGIFLCEQSSHELLNILKPSWNININSSLPQKILDTNLSFELQDIFPFKEELSPAINPDQFAASFLVQPDLFLRIRQKRRETMMQRLNKSGLPFTMKNADCLALPNGTNVETLFALDHEAVIQDYNSQQVLHYLTSPPVLALLEPFQKYSPEFRHTRVIKAWDCCAASGGKSILLYDVLHRAVKPTVSDIRLPIIMKLHQRFKKAGIRFYDYFICDLEKNILPEMTLAPFPVIICDAPCTGSGTWGRTPEQLFFFKKEKIISFSERQKAIVTNAIHFLAKDGLFFYITCSVFKKENEIIAEYIQENLGLSIQQMELLKGYDKKADTMFVAVFKK